MKLVNCLVLLSLSINIKSELEWINALSFSNLSLKGTSEYQLEGFFEYLDHNESSYLSIDQNNSEYCLQFTFRPKKLILQYACQNVCSEVSLQDRIRGRAEHYNTIGPKHCPMQGIISSAYIKRDTLYVTNSKLDSRTLSTGI